MLLVLRKPLLVVLGNWNPAIFRPAWIAQHVFGVRTGEEFHANQVQVNQQQIVGGQYFNTPLSTVTYSSQVGIACSSNRLEIFANEANDETFRLAERATLGVLKTLSHTPVSNFGINFNFFDPEPEAAITDLLETDEALARIKPIINRELRTRFRFNEICDLNFKRTLDDEGLQLDFNFHHENQGMEGLIDQVPDIFQTYYVYLLESFGEKYNLVGLDEIEILKHDFSGTETVVRHDDE